QGDLELEVVFVSPDQDSDDDSNVVVETDSGLSFNLYEPFGDGGGDVATPVANGGSTTTNGSVPNGNAHGDHAAEAVAGPSVDAPSKQPSNEIHDNRLVETVFPQGLVALTLKERLHQLSQDQASWKTDSVFNCEFPNQML
uniref:Uncharacterized protein n=1 Tax=Plectus sambesii TaxID=2011161 RepID=A0A914X8V8_9BILA